MIDLHTHLLPNIDDGSSSVEESLKLLDIIRNQGIRTICATPHFYPEKISLGKFLRKRSESYEAIGSPSDVLLGAEVGYFPNIGRSDNLENLTIGKSGVLLLEMPFYKWHEEELENLYRLTQKNFTVVMAHIERYGAYAPVEMLTEIQTMGILFQVNPGMILEENNEKILESYLKRGWIAFLGSDTHNLTHRPPMIGQAALKLYEKSPESYLQIEKNIHQYFE